MTKILLIPSDPTLGTDFYRATGPFSRLNCEIIKPDGGMLSWATLSDIDIIFVQRPATPTEVNYLEIAKKCNTPIWLDYDDDPFNLNADNPVEPIWNRDDKKASIRASLKLADVITVSTEALKEALLEEVEDLDIRVVPNATDDKLFHMEPSNHPRNKVIVMRGGSSHKDDWFQCKDALVQILTNFPEYTLAVMGYHPEWLREIPEKQLRLYEFKDIPTYIDTLMQLRPEIGLVPLCDNKFNRSKSNIAWQEFTMAGAITIASNLPEFQQPGVTHIKGLSVSESLHFHFNKLLGTNWIECDANDVYYRSPYNKAVNYERSFQAVPKLSEINKIRTKIIQELKKKRTKYRPYILREEVATPLEFHEYSLSHGHTQDYPSYKKLHAKTAEWIIDTLNPKTATELGAGTGGTLLELLKRGVMAYGAEYNEHAVDYFQQNHPMYANQIYHVDITEEKIEVDQPGDLVYSFEVFEHIDKPEEWWINYLTDLSTKFRHFYFSSTPYYDNEYFQKWWGHVNVRKTSDWIKLFEKSGWRFISNPKVLVNWDLLFVSTSI